MFCIAQHRTTLHKIAVHDMPFHSVIFQSVPFHSVPLRYATLHYTTLHYTTLHNTERHFTIRTVQCNTRQSINTDQTRPGQPDLHIHPSTHTYIDTYIHKCISVSVCVVAFLFRLDSFCTCRLLSVLDCACVFNCTILLRHIDLGVGSIRPLSKFVELLPILRPVQAEGATSQQLFPDGRASQRLGFRARNRSATQAPHPRPPTSLNPFTLNPDKRRDPQEHRHPVITQVPRSNPSDYLHVLTRMLSKVLGFAFECPKPDRFRVLGLRALGSRVRGCWSVRGLGFESVRV